jgi:hypothetical protein
VKGTPPTEARHAHSHPAVFRARLFSIPTDPCEMVRHYSLGADDLALVCNASMCWEESLPMTSASLFSASADPAKPSQASSPAIKPRMTAPVYTPTLRPPARHGQERRPPGGWGRRLRDCGDVGGVRAITSQMSFLLIAPFYLPLAPGRQPAYPVGEIRDQGLNYTVFDTHAFVKRLTAAGMPEAQAEVLADEQVRLIDDRLATKEDIAKLQASTTVDITELQAATKTDLRELELKIEAKLERFKLEIIAWMSGTIGFQTIVLVGSVVALARLSQH